MKIRTIAICICCIAISGCLSYNDNTAESERAPTKADRSYGSGQRNHVAPATNPDSISDYHQYPGYNAKDDYPILPTATGSELCR